MTRRYVCFNAEDRGVRVTVEDDRVGWADNAGDLAAILMAHDISLGKDACFNSSSMDFATEYGFKTNDGAQDMVAEAFDIFAN
jgi:hypothetical protein